MSRGEKVEGIAKGAIAGLFAGLVASWSANQFHSLWSRFRGEEENPEVARLSQRGGRPDTAAAKERVASGKTHDEEDATIVIGSKLSNAVLERPLTWKEKHRSGVAVHYAFGAASGALYGAIAEVVPSTKMLSGVGFGLAVWLVGVEALLPALHLTEPPWQYPPRMHVYSFISHGIYGAATERIRRSLRDAL
jgi:putative membrane protein